MVFAFSGYETKKSQRDTAALYKSYDVIKSRKKIESLNSQDDREPSPSKNFNETDRSLKTLN